MKYRRFLNKREKPTEYNISISPYKDSTFSNIFKYAASASQVGLLILAIFGYFYTVVPIYEKALLDEEIAKKEIELSGKNDEIDKKNSELNSLSKSITEINEHLNSVKVEARNLRKTVTGQYNELRHRLIDEFKYIANQECQINLITSQLFSICIKEKVLASYSLKPLRKKDKNLLYTLSQKIDSELSEKWKKKSILLHEKIKANKLKLSNSESKCNERRKDPDYQNTIKKIEIDYFCDIDLNEVRFERIKIDIEAIRAPRDITKTFTTKIKNNFINGA